MIYSICMAANLCILAYGAVIDYKEREIPDIVPVVLILTGLITGWDILLLRFAEMLLTAVLFLLSAKLTGAETPGGDFKLLSALTFSSGLPILLFSLLLTGLGAVLIPADKKQSTKRSIPLCAYIAPAYLIVGALQLIF